MPGTVGIRALQQHASAVVDRVAGGETIEVTDRGRPVARLVPVTDSPLEDLVRAGQARPARRRVSALAAPLNAPEGVPSLGELLNGARADER